MEEGALVGDEGRRGHRNQSSMQRLWEFTICQTSPGEGKVLVTKLEGSTRQRRELVSLTKRLVMVCVGREVDYLLWADVLVLR